MRRRDVLLLLSAGALFHSSRAGSQTPERVRRLGWLSSGAPGPSLDTFRQALREHGFEEGKHYTIEQRYAEGQISRLDALARDLVGLDPDVIIAAPSSAAAATKNVTATIPIVVPLALDAVRAGLVANLSHPGGNLTGLTLRSSDLIAKRLELLREAVPGLKRVALLSVAGVPHITDPFVQEMRAAADRLGLSLQVAEVGPGKPLEETFRLIAEGGAQGLYVLESLALDVRREEILKHARLNKLSVIAAGRDYARLGALITYGGDSRHLYRRAAELVAKILEGAKPGDLPMEQPTEFNLVINLKVARELGLDPSPHLLALAEEVIE